MKYSIYNVYTHSWIAKGLIEKIGLNNPCQKHESELKKINIEINCNNHTDAIKIILDTLIHSDQSEIDNVDSIIAVGHRVVHGGEFFSESTLISENIIETLEKLSTLAPLHNPPNIEGIKVAQLIMPNIPHIAVFDTAFHHTIPDYAYMYALPFSWYEKYKIRRYGFHGSSHRYVSQKAIKRLRKDYVDSKIITLHIGNGSSVAAIKNGISIDTSMGFTPLEGCVMGTRCGDIDPAIPLYMMEKENMSTADMNVILNKKSGLLGITNEFSDRRDIENEAHKGNKLCKLALNIEAYRLKKYIGALTAVLGGLDAIVFTAGVGENSPLMREKIITGLSYLGVNLDKEKNKMAIGGKKEFDISTDDSAVQIFVIPTNEELVIAQDAYGIVKGLNG